MTLLTRQQQQLLGQDPSGRDLSFYCCSQLPSEPTRRLISARSPGSVDVQGGILDEFSKLLLVVLDRPVINKTEITGRFDLRIEFSRDGTKLASMPLLRDGSPAPASDYSTDAPSIFVAIQEQLGLKLEPAKGPVEMFVIDHVAKPTGN